MPKSVLNMDFATVTTSEDIVYIIQGTGNNRDRKVCLKDLAQGIIKGSNLPHNTPTIVAGAGVLAQTVYPYGSADIEAYALQPETVVASGFRNLPLYNEVSDWNSATLPVESRILGSGGTSKSAKIPLSIVTDVSKKVLVHDSNFFEYTIQKMDKHLVLYLTSANSSKFTIHGTIPVGGTIEVHADTLVSVGNDQGLPQQSKNYFGALNLPDYVNSAMVYVYRGQTELLIAQTLNTLFRTPTRPAEERVVEFYQVANLTNTTGSWSGFIPSGMPANGSAALRRKWVAFESYKIKGFDVAFIFPGGLTPGQWLNVILRFEILDMFQNITSAADLDFSFPNFEDESIDMLTQRIAIGDPTQSYHILRGHALRFSMTYTWLQDGTAYTDVIGRVSAIFEKLPIQNQFLA